MAKTLIDFVRAKNYGMVKQLLENNESPNAIDGTGQTALQYAASLDETSDITSLLLAHGADMRAVSQSYGNNTPLAWACKNKKEHNIAAILNTPDQKNNINSVINYKNTDGETPLELALKSRCSFDTIRLLMDSGAKLNLKILNLVCKDFKYSDGFLKELLKKARESNDFVEIVNEQNAQGKMLLQILIENKYSADTLLWLLESDAKLTLPILMLACETENYMSVLLEYIEKNEQFKALLNEEYKKNCVLKAALMKNFSLPTITKLLDLGAVPDIHMLIWACQNKKEELIKTLLEHPGEGTKELVANINEKEVIEAGNHAGTITRALDKALLNNCSIDTVKLLCEKGSKVISNHLFWACKKQNQGYLSLLLENVQGDDKGEILNTRKDSETLLISGLRNGLSFDNIKLLIGQGVDCNITNKIGSKPLLIALDGRPDDHELINYLIDRTDCDAANQHGITPLLVATYHNKPAIMESILAKSRATINSSNKKGDTPLRYALDFGALPLLEVLVKYKVDFSRESSECYLDYLRQASFNVAELILANVPAEKLLPYKLKASTLLELNKFQETLELNKALQDNQKASLHKTWNREIYFADIHAYFLKKAAKPKEKASYHVRVDDFAKLLKCISEHSLESSGNFAKALNDYFTSGQAATFGKNPITFLGRAVVATSTQEYEKRRDRLREITPEEAVIIQRRYVAYATVLHKKINTALPSKATPATLEQILERQVIEAITAEIRKEPKNVFVQLEGDDEEPQDASRLQEML